MEGQFMTIVVPGNTSLSLCEVQVFGLPRNFLSDLRYIHLEWRQNGAPNVAPKGVASQSSDFHADRGKADVAIDGKLANIYPQCTHTRHDIEPWWMVDLTLPMRIFSVAVTNRRECCGFRLNGAEIRVGSSPNVKSNPRCAVLTTVDAGKTLSVECHGMVGRYVSVIIPNRREFLTLCEVQVFALPAGVPKYEKLEPEERPRDPTAEELEAEERSIIAEKREAEERPRAVTAEMVPKIALKEASQSSTYGRSYPRNAIAGNLILKVLETDCSVTEEEYEPWWATSLDGNYLISAIAITRRQGCCDSGLDGAEIHIGYDADWRKNPICGIVSSIGLGKTFSFKCNGMGGRFVTVAIPDKTTSLSLCHVQLFGKKVDTPISICTAGQDDELWRENHGALNVAPLGEASQPPYGSYIYGREAKLAIDENLSTDFYDNSCIHTKEEQDPWWSVDLRSPMRVSSVTITNRGDCCKQRLNGAELRIGNSKNRDNPRCAVISSHSASEDTFHLNCEGMVGRYVSIVITGRREWLHLCEVQVFAEPTEDQTEGEKETPADGDKKKLSQSRPVTVSAREVEKFAVLQSSTNHSAVVRKATGRSKPSEGPKSQCAVTQEEYQPWWKAELPKPYKVYAVALTNRGDCCAAGLDGAEIRVGEDGMDWRNNSLCGTVSSIGLGETYSFTCNWLRGKFITIIIPNKTTSLVLCEVQVFGVALGAKDNLDRGKIGEIGRLAPPALLNHGAVNVARRGMASQSSHYDHTRYAKSAIDGDKSVYYFQRSCAHIESVFGPWWRVELVSKMRVFSVAVTNRRDCCDYRLIGAEIRIGDSEEQGGIGNPRCAEFNAMGTGETFIFDCNGMEGRFVTIVLPDQNQPLTICEVQVFAEPAEDRKEEMFYNLALNGAASQSSTLSIAGEASNANDGSLTNNHIMAQCSITERDLSPYWMVDLQDAYKVFSVVVTNRVLECCKDRIYGAEIRVGNSSSDRGMLNPRCGVITSMESGESLSFSCNGMVGRYVSVTIPGREEHLILCEVQVFGLPEKSNANFVDVDQQSLEIQSGVPNVARNGVSSQSSLYNDFGNSKNAIDGSLSGDYAQMGCSQTAWEMRPWWAVDLQKVHQVFSVAVTNRRDCCWERINEAEIRIGNSKEWQNNNRCAVIYSLPPGETGMFNCKGMKGRYVTVIIPDREEKLSLCEVQVFGLPVTSDGDSPTNDNEAKDLGGKGLVFPEEGIDNYAVLFPSSPLHLSEFTLCLRVFTELPANRQVILFSYHNDADALNLWRESDGRIWMYLSIKDHAVKFSIPGLSSFGVHLCVSWESISGLTSFWFNGQQSVSKIYRKGHQVLPGGFVILGQDQDKPGSGFDAKQSFVGVISDVHLWSRALPAGDIQEVYEGTSRSWGNIINWNSLRYKLYGNAIANQGWLRSKRSGRLSKRGVM